MSSIDEYYRLLMDVKFPTDKNSTIADDSHQLGLNETRRNLNELTNFSTIDELWAQLEQTVSNNVDDELDKLNSTVEIGKKSVEEMKFYLPYLTASLKEGVLRPDENVMLLPISQENQKMFHDIVERLANLISTSNRLVQDKNTIHCEDDIQKVVDKMVTCRDTAVSNETQLRGFLSEVESMLSDYQEMISKK